ncbi:hypothetical protein ACHAWU_009268 [Discostella pseudostelligera]|uniref:HSF-type DNA-binding domain-containing protein n=1 Tax=Discostella pseudostelligera TaxID=259834 RepID=A0ABD3M215_9STRA
MKMMVAQSQAANNNTRSTATTHRRRRAPQRPGKTATQKERLFVQHNYHDLANEMDSPAGSTTVMEAATTKFDVSSPSALSASSSSSSNPFPIKLHHLLEESEASGLGHIISWQPHGRAFKIHNPTLFTDTIMQKYFPKMRKLPSLQRQFNLYGFERLTRDGPDAGAYYHEAFLRYRPGLSLARMTRKRVKGTGYKAASNPEAEPNLYAFPFMVPTTTASTKKEEEAEEKALSGLQQQLCAALGTSDMSFLSSNFFASAQEQQPESPSLQQQQQQQGRMTSSPYQVVSSSSSSASSSWPSPSMPSSSNNDVMQASLSPQMSYTTSNGLGNNLMSTTSSPVANPFAMDSFMDRYLNLPQSTQDSMLQDVLTMNDSSSVDPFMDKYLSGEGGAAMTSTSFSRQGSITSSSWTELPSRQQASSIAMPPLLQGSYQRGRSMGSFSVAPIMLGKDLESDVDGFMDRYLSLPRATQDSILQDLLCLNDGGAGDANSSSSMLSMDPFCS